MRRLPAFIFAFALTLVASSADAETQTITGEVISISCYLHNRANVGRAGFVCALATVKWESNPVGLLTADGKIYQLTGGLTANNNAKIVPSLSQTVTVTGHVFERAGMTMLEADELKRGPAR